MISRPLRYLLPILLMAVFVFLCGCSSIGSNNDAIRIDNYSIYVNQSYHVNIQYLDNWTVQEGGVQKIVTFYPPDSDPSNATAASFEVRLDYMGSSSGQSSLMDLYQFGIHESFVMAPLSGRKASISEPSDTKLGGLPALIMNYTDTVDNNTVNGMIIYTLKDSSWKDENGQKECMTRYYVLEYSANAVDYGEHLDDARRMIDSFRFN